MNDFTRINAPRVEKIVAMIETIHKSARSNRVGEREVKQLLEPMRMAERSMGDLADIALSLPPGVVPAPPPAPTPIPTLAVSHERKDIALWKEAQTAPLGDLMMAYTTITARLADLVDETS